MIGGHLPFTLIVGVATAGATMFGGGLVLRFRGSLDLLVGLSSGAVLGVAFFDLLPEALALYTPGVGFRTAMGAAALGFTLYLFADRLTPHQANTASGRGGHLGPASLTVHSLMDGIAIGLAFKVSEPAGLVAAVAVLTHDLFDGANTVTLGLFGGIGDRAARRWLVADALAPLAGLAAAYTLIVPKPALALLLAMFAGCFIYIGASELLPRSRSDAPLKTATLFAAGLFLLYMVVHLASA